MAAPTVYLTDEAEAYRDEVALMYDGPHYTEERLRLSVILCPPTRYRVDLDNRIKPLLDALQAAKAFTDDEQIDELIAIRGQVGKPGGAFVRIDEL